MQICSKCKLNSEVVKFYTHSPTVCIPCKRKYFKSWYDPQREKARNKLRMDKFKTYRKQTRKNHPERHLAREIIHKALLKGEIIKEPCKMCKNKKSEAHHPDYSKPLEVIWLCRKHHVKQHKP